MTDALSASSCASASALSVSGCSSSSSCDCHACIANTSALLSASCFQSSDDLRKASFAKVSASATTMTSSSNSSSNCSRDSIVSAVPVASLPRIELTPAQKREYRQLANAALAQILETYLEYKTLAHQFGVFHAPWKKVANSHGLTCYSKRLQSNGDASKKYASKGTASTSTTMGQMEGNYRDFVRFFQTSDRERYLDIQRQFYGSVVDAAQLNRIELGKEQDPTCSLTVRWGAFDFSSQKLRFDCCQLEYLGFATDEKGKELGFRIVLPIDLAECPEGFYSDRFKRASIASSTLVIPSRTDDEYSEVFISTEEDFGTRSIPSSFYRTMMGSIARTGRQCCHSKYFSQPEINKAKWIPNEQRKECCICERAFNAFRHRHHCRLCGEVVCAKCMVTMSDTKEASNLVVRKKKKVCLTCISNVRQDRNASFVKQHNMVEDCSDTESLASTNRYDFDLDVDFPLRPTMPNSVYSRSVFNDSVLSDGTPSNNQHHLIDEPEFRSMPPMSRTRSRPKEDEIILNIDTQDMVPARFLSRSDSANTMVSHGSSQSSLESSKVVMGKIDEAIAEQEKLLDRLRRIRTLS